MMTTRWFKRIASSGVTVALAAALGAGLFSVSTPSQAADGRYYRMPDGRVEYVRDRDLRKWRRDQERRWRNSGRYGAPYDGRGSGELGDSPREWRYQNRDWSPSNQWGRPEGGRYYRYPADGG